MPDLTDDSAMVIIGAGEAGARAASTFREQGFSGRVCLIGDEPHGPYERPPLSKAIMSTDVGHPPLILDEAKLAEQKIDHIGGVFVDRIDTLSKQVLLRDGRTIPYASVLIATGAASRRLTTPGATDDNVLYLRTFADAVAMRTRLVPGSSLVVIGGGFIGLEIAASAIERGCAVTLVEMAPRILMRGVPPEVADLVRARHEQAGVDFRVGVGIDRVEGRGSRHAVILADGSELECDLIVAGVGAVPETKLAEASGLAIDNGVRVDSHLRTTDPHVFAAGDCCSFPHPLFTDRRLRLEAWRNAQDQGAMAARNMMGGDEVYAAVPWFWSDQYDQGLQVAGLTDEGSSMIVRDMGPSQLFFHLASDGRLVAASGIGPGNAISRDIKIAEMLIARRAKPEPSSLASPDVKLKSLL